jgi:alpha-amylase/alpha-mannosidase (GH57 family)
MLADAGIEWIATDEEILAHSIKEYVRRDGHGHVRNPEMLYKPYVAEASDKRMHIFFRDHYLSDLIGFHYSAAEANAAVADFESRLRNVVSSPVHALPARVRDGRRYARHVCRIP